MKNWSKPTLISLQNDLVQSNAIGAFSTEFIKYCYGDMIKTQDNSVPSAFDSTRTTQNVVQGLCS